MLLIIRLVLFLLIARAVLMLARGVMQGLNDDGGRPPKTVSGGQLVRDPVCGVYLSPSHALTLQSGAGTAYFCSEKCRQAWRKP
jgi:YHS domain-containing protein